MINEIDVELEVEEPTYDTETELSIVVNRTDFVLKPATTTTLGGIIVGQDLQITENGVLSVIKANEVDEDNTHPITAAAVYTEVGNINALLQTI